MYLLDTDWLVDIFVGVPRAVSTLREIRPQGVGLSIVSYAEFFEGAYGLPDTEFPLARYREFLDQFDTVPLSKAISEVFGRLRAELRRAGQLIPDLDLLIAATAIHLDLILLSRNLRHFNRIPELELYHPR